MTLFLLSAAALVLAVASWSLFTYNALVRLNRMADAAWADVDVHLKKRHDLVENLVQAVRGYAAHEREAFERVASARTQASGATALTERAAAERDLALGAAKLIALSEAYPELKASASFLALQKELAELEDDLAQARRYYNAVIRDYNTRTERIPSTLIASLAGFRARPFFELEPGEAAAPRVSLAK